MDAYTLVMGGLSKRERESERESERERERERESESTKESDWTLGRVYPREDVIAFGT